ncbi:MAG: hypothetical protein ACHQQP_00570 [Gemmatimonadales bacterium]|jgi:hypothetical protein
MDPAQAIVSIIAVIGSFSVPVALMYMWVHRPSAKTQLQPGRTDPALEARLERIEVAVQAIALETERIAEGQRFTTKLLTASSDRSLGSPARQGG